MSTRYSLLHLLHDPHPWVNAAITRHSRYTDLCISDFLSAPFVLKTKIASSPSRSTRGATTKTTTSRMSSTTGWPIRAASSRPLCSMIEVVGIAKLTDMGDDEWWFEGLRIDPAYRRRGIASEFNRYHVASGEAAGRQSRALHDGRRQRGQPDHRRAGGLSAHPHLHRASG